MEDRGSSFQLKWNRENSGIYQPETKRAEKCHCKSRQAEKTKTQTEVGLINI